MVDRYPASDHSSFGVVHAPLIARLCQRTLDRPEVRLSERARRVTFGLSLTYEYLSDVTLNLAIKLRSDNLAIKLRSEPFAPLHLIRHTNGEAAVVHSLDDVGSRIEWRSRPSNDEINVWRQ